MTLEEWERRFKARIVDKLKPFKLPGSKRRTGWTEAEAVRAAQGEWDAVEPSEHMNGFAEDPEGAADEALSYWSDGI